MEENKEKEAGNGPILKQTSSRSDVGHDQPSVWSVFCK